MMPSQCPYTRMVERSRDGLLTAVEDERVKRHLSDGCQVCETEVRSLDRLREALSAHVPTVDEVGLQRSRRQLLTRAEFFQRRALPRRQHRLGVAKGACAAAALMGLGYVAFDRTPEISIDRLTGRGNYERYTEGNHSVVRLTDGSYKLQVTRGLFDRGVLVRLPDGEIEDIGTIFGVIIEAGRTRRVEVSEGAVKLRMHGNPQVTLGPGSAWAPTVAETQVDATEVSAVESSAPAASGAPPAVPTLDPERSPPTEAPSPTAGSTHPPKRKVRGHAASRDEQQPSTLAEDAMYLRVLELLREQQPQAARSLAKRYLEAFPQGFRRSEVARIAGAPAP